MGTFRLNKRQQQSKSQQIHTLTLALESNTPVSIALVVAVRLFDNADCTLWRDRWCVWLV